MTAITITITINLVNFQVVIDLLNLILELDPSVLGPVDGSKLMGDILVDLLDIDLAISEVHFIITIIDGSKLTHMFSHKIKLSMMKTELPLFRIAYTWL